MSENMTQLLAKLAAVTERAEKAEEEVEAMKLENGFVHMHKIDDAESWKDRAESAEEELLAVREDNHSMMLEIDGLRTERDALASELAKLRAQEPVAYLDYWKSDGTGIVRKQRTTGVPFFNSPVPAPAVPAPTPFLPDADTRRNDEAFAAQQEAIVPSVPDVLIQLRDKVTKIPRRTEYLSGQQFAYVRLCEVVGEIEALLQSSDHSSEVKK